MKTNKTTFRTENLANIKTVFEERTGASLNPQAKVKAHPVFKRTITIALALALCAALGITALAASVPEVYEFLYRVSPATAQFFKPVKIACDDNGIRMEVISTYVHGNTAEIYISLQDVTGDRLDMTTDLYDSYSINSPFSFSGFMVKNGSYDDETKTLTSLITITLNDGQKFEGDKLTFRLGNFLSHKQIFEDLALDVDLSNVSLTPSIQALSHDRLRGGGGNGIDEYPMHAPIEEGLPMTFDALSPASQPIAVVDGVTLTAIGFIDGKLHVQTLYDDILRTDNHGYLYLKDSNGNIVSTLYSISFWAEKVAHAQDMALIREGRDSYDEEVFDISPSDLDEYTLHGNFFTCDTLVEGNWEVTYPLQVDNAQE
ncbi:MAG: DUF4179 domain-containing protein [Clostridiales bacterium]|nr:DUF4179 domain-containing protein [Clostridiales bacterium]